MQNKPAKHTVLFPLFWCKFHPLESNAFQSFFTAHQRYSTLISSLKTKLNSDEHTDLGRVLDFPEL